MANVFYPFGKQAFAAAGINWVSDNIRVILIDTALYTYNPAHDFLDDVAAGARVATLAATLASKTNALGVLGAADPTFSSVVAGRTVSAFIVYKHTGTDSTSQLIAYFDTATNLPILTNGGNITLDLNATGIFAL